MYIVMDGEDRIDSIFTNYHDAKARANELNRRGEEAFVYYDEGVSL